MLPCVTSENFPATAIVCPLNLPTRDSGTPLESGLVDMEGAMMTTCGYFIKSHSDTGDQKAEGSDRSVREEEGLTVMEGLSR